MTFISNFIIGLSLVIFTPTAKSETFEVQQIPDNLKTEIKEFKTWKEGCPIPVDRLRLIKFSYYDFEGKEKNEGQIVVMDASANRILKIFKELHAIKFPIAKANPIEYYKGSDEASMADNNTSAFNCREITGGSLPSIHSYGLAIDINPVQNPYISFDEKEGCLTKILPAEGKNYINRANQKIGMAESVKNIFEKNGFFVWGGTWTSPIDWQHFQTPRPLAQLLASMSSKDALEFFEIYSASSEHKIFEPEKNTTNSLVELYYQSPTEFMSFFRTHPNIFTLSSDEASNFIKGKINKKETDRTQTTVPSPLEEQF